MSIVNVNFNNITGKIKPMHAVNNGPIKGGYEQVRSNFDDFKAAKIPYVRNHDASFCSAYGGAHTVDVHMIFPDFDADVNDPASYDFYYTDKKTQKVYNLNYTIDGKPVAVDLAMLYSLLNAEKPQAIILTEKKESETDKE